VTKPENDTLVEKDNIVTKETILEAVKKIEYQEAQNKNADSSLDVKDKESSMLPVGTTFMALGKEYIVTYVNEGKKRMTIEPYESGK